MSQLMSALAGLLSHLWILIVAHFQVAYYLAVLLATPAAIAGQATAPAIGQDWANVLTFVLDWATFLAAYSFIRAGGLNPLMRKLWPWRKWEGAWWSWNWAAALSGLVKRRLIFRRPQPTGQATASESPAILAAPAEFAGHAAR